MTMLSRCLAYERKYGYRVQDFFSFETRMPFTLEKKVGDMSGRRDESPRRPALPIRKIRERREFLDWSSKANNVDMWLLLDMREYVINRYGMDHGFKRCFEEMDLYDTGRVTEIQFDHLMRKWVGYPVRSKQLRRIFKLIDKDEKGFITIADWIRIKSVISQLPNLVTK